MNSGNRSDSFYHCSSSSNILIFVSSITLIVWKRCTQIANNASPRSTVRFFVLQTKKKDEKLGEKAKLDMRLLRNVFLKEK